MASPPRIFVASSREGIAVAEAVVIKLEQEGRVKLWDNAFDLSSVTIVSLEARAKDTDFAVFVFHRDDRAFVRGSETDVVRDNVLFELGLFIGALGRERCFVLVPKSTENAFRIPTDLQGVTFSSYDDTEIDMVDAVAASCAKIKIAVRRQSALIESQPPERSVELEVLTKELQSVQSNLWREKIDGERAAEEKGRFLAAITTHFFAVAKPATEAEILAWEAGAKKNYPSGPLVRRHHVYFLDSNAILPPLFGANSIAVIVASGVRLHGLELGGHNAVYLMDGFRKLGH